MVNSGSDRKTVQINITLLAYLLIYIPVFIFFLTWTKWYISILFTVAVSIGLYRQMKDDNPVKININIKNLLFGLSACVPLLLWLLLCGVGGMTPQTSDYKKHNYMLKLLTENNWPVTDHYNNREGKLVYYIGSYILPSLVGKITNSTFLSDLATLLFCLAELLIVCILIYKILGLKDKRIIFVILTCMIFFETFVNPVKDIYVMLFHSADPSSKLFSDEYCLVFPGNTSQLLWAYAQVVPAWLCTILFIKEQKRKEKWGMIIFPLMFYSIFAFVGLFMICVIAFISDLIALRRIRSDFRNLFSIANISSILIGSLLTIYYSGTLLQSKPAEAHLEPKIINHLLDPKALIFFIISWAIWWGICMIKEKDRTLLLSTFLSMVAISFVLIGKNNDFVDRACIPMLFIICFYVIKIIVNQKSIYKIILICLVIFAGLPEIIFACSNLNGRLSSENRQKPYDSLNEYIDDDGVIIEYQYYCWEDCSIIPIIRD